MRERINRLAKGIIDSEVPKLVITPSAVEGSVPAGTTARGELMVISGNGLHIKGLIYSGNPRVTVANNAFGGLRNRIVYEVNSKYCEHGEVIKGSFYLVTNGGEKEIPYSLRIQAGSAGETLESLKTPDDFGRLAKRDLEKALQLFEYQDFVETPFMQDARCRTLYDGLRGRPGRRNLLEEFLVALGVKEPVELSVDTKSRNYENPLDTIEDKIEIRVNGWGYVSAQIEADEPFIELGTDRITDRDFSGGRCCITYRIRPKYLHRGKNFGRIRIVSLKESFTVAVEAEGDETVDITHRDPEADMHIDKDSLLRYLSLRLNYETGVYEPALLRNQMAKEVEQLRENYREDDLVRLLQAELFLAGGKKDAAASVLEECRDHVMERREKQVENYCFYQYLKLQLSPSQSQQESLIRLIGKYLEEDGSAREYLFFLLLKLDPTLKQNPLELYLRMKSMHQEGCRSPFLYTAACRLLEDHLDLLASLGDFEVQALHLGARKGMVSQEMAAKAAHLALSLRHYRRMYERLMTRLYELYPRVEILAAVCSILIKGDRRGAGAFQWYKLALENGVNLTRLYEYFLYSLPGDYGHLLPKEVLLYFSYEKDLDEHSRKVLYKNILLYMNPSLELYQTYTRHMEKFAMEQLFASRIDSRLAVIYDHIIYKDMIDRRVARVLPGILKSYRIKCRDSRMKYVIVRYEELNEDYAYLLEENVAYVPIYADNIVLLFQDAFGNRYADVQYWKVPVMDKPELLEKCYQVYPEHTMLRLAECRRILETGIERDDQAEFVEQIIQEMDLNPVFARRLSTVVTDYYCRKAEDETDDGSAFDCAYLVQMDKEELTAAQRQKICGTLISQNYFREAYEMIRLYGSENISAGRRMKLCAKMILQSLFDQDEVLLNLSYGVFREGRYDSVILDYLCEHFNGTVSQMYEVLIRGVEEHVETYDLEERLLAQMMFTGSTDQIDSVFQLYVNRKKTRESVVKAYFTEKSIAYFLDRKQVDGRVFEYLESAVNQSIEKDKVPTIYLLALTLYYANCVRLSEEQIRLCRLIGGLLISEGLVFPYTRELSRHMAVPEDIMDKAMVEYIGRRDGRPELLVRILPDEEQFHSEELRRVYQGIFVKQKVLFEGETMEYRIYDYEEGKRVLAAEGRVACDHKLDGKENSRFALLNQMGAAQGRKDEEALKKAMEDYLKKAAVLSELFSII